MFEDCSSLNRLLTSDSGGIVGTFGLAAGVGALFFFGEVPRVRRDILQQFPFFDQYFDRRLAPEDNVSFGFFIVGIIWKIY